METYVNLFQFELILYLKGHESFAILKPFSFVMIVGVETKSLLILSLAFVCVNLSKKSPQK